MAWGVHSGSRHAEDRDIGGFELVRVHGKFAVYSELSRTHGVMDNCDVACNFALPGACLGVKVRNILGDLV